MDEWDVAPTCIVAESCLEGRVPPPHCGFPTRCVAPSWRLRRELGYKAILTARAVRPTDLQEICPGRGISGRYQPLLWRKPVQRGPFQL